MVSEDCKSPFSKKMGHQKPKNIFIGNNALRGLDCHEKRFGDWNIDPTISSRIHKQLSMNWKVAKQRNLDFSIRFYCKNGNYNPDQKVTQADLSVGSKYLP